MIATIIACCYITFICYAWGAACLKVFAKLQNTEQEFHFGIISFIGMAVVATVASMLSLFIPLGNWQVQLIFLLPAFYFIRYAKIPRLSFNAGIASLAIVTLIGIVLMSCWWIIHPDTLGYHAQIIKWIEEFKAIPGLLHLSPRYGYQNSWFVTEALFSFRFTGINALSFTNISVLSWFVLFVCDRINNSIKEQKAYRGLLWLMLLAFSLWSYAQVRLTATSASPDFIATLAILMVFYLLFQNASWLLLISISVFAVTVKLSAIPVLIIAFYGSVKLLQTRSYRMSLLGLILALLIMIPFVTRNVITSGWALFPSSFPDIVNVDWKYSEKGLAEERDYINAYARARSDRAVEEVATTLNASFTEWMPAWWKDLSLPDKLLIILATLSLLYLLARTQRIIRNGTPSWMTSIVVIAGVIFWFIQAPDPRFGAAFLMMLPVLALKDLKLHIKPAFAMIAAITLTIVVAAYTVYRVINFFEPEQLLAPAGLKKQHTKLIMCNGIEVHVPTNEEPCGEAPVPCIFNGCERFELRDSTLKHGFRARITPGNNIK